MKYYEFGTRKWQDYFANYVTPKGWKKGARDVPFGMGAKTLYVDDTNGDDTNDGESWKTATKTIQEAVDKATHWTNIFIKTGSYTESVHIDSKHAIALIGASRAGVHITAPTGGTAITSSAICFEDSLNGSIHNIKLTSADYYGAYFLNSDIGLVENCYCYECKGGVKAYNAKDAIFRRNIIDGNNKDVTLAKGGIVIDSTSDRAEIAENTISNYIGFGAGIWIFANDCVLHDNSMKSLIYGVYIDSALTVSTIYHNNIITCTTAYINDQSTNADVFENFYFEHTNVDNGFGIAKAPYAYTGGTDPRPVIVRNGWRGLSWADADLVALASVCTEARLAELAAANIPADIDLILADTNELQTDWKNGGRLDILIDTILADVTGINGAAMRGTDSAALASVCTEARLAELAAANIPADIDAIYTIISENRLTETMFRYNAGFGTASEPFRINDNQTGEDHVGFDNVGEYAEINFGAPRYIKEFRMWGLVVMNGTGRWKIQHWTGSAWVDNTTNITVALTEAWGSWISLTTPEVTHKIRFVCTTLDTANNESYIIELQMRG